MMKGMLRVLSLPLALTMMSGGLAVSRPSEAGTGQSEKQATCSGPVYKTKDVSRRAKIIDRPRPAGEPEGDGDWEEKGRVVLKAVLCHTGEVTDIEVVEGLPDGLTEKAIAAARQIKFTPAERRGQKVSQRAVFEYNFRVRD